MGFTGLVADLYTPINHDAITTHYDKLFFITTPYAPAGPSGMVMPSQTTKFLRYICLSKISSLSMMELSIADLHQQTTTHF